MAIKPILFSTEMVRAIQAKRKTVTRRVLKPQPDNAHFCFGFDDEEEAFEFMCGSNVDGIFKDWSEFIKPLYQVGDILWVRETWKKVYFQGEPHFLYKADELEDVQDDLPPIKNWRPSIHMPREAARIFLRVTDIWAERLQEIKPKSAGEEGVEWETDNSGQFRRYQFSQLWDKTIKTADLPRYGWGANPWVQVTRFEQCEKPENWEV